MVFLRNSYYCDFSPIPPSVHCKGSFIWSLPWLVFTVLALNYICLVWVSLPTTYWSSVVQPPLLTYAGCAAPFCQTKKTILFVCLPWLFYPLRCVCSLFIPYSMHLVVPTHPYFFWVACYPSRTFPLKEPEQKPQNKLFPSPPPDHVLSYLWPMTHHFLYWLGTGWWCLGLARASPFSPIAHAFAVIWRFVCTFCRALLVSYGMGCFPICHSLWLASLWGLGLVGSWVSLLSAYSVFTSWPC